MHSAT
jgi:hypothetical protein